MDTLISSDVAYLALTPMVVMFLQATQLREVLRPVGVEPLLVQLASASGLSQSIGRRPSTTFLDARHGYW